MIGQVVNYRYEILEKCGDGSFFAVYKARDKVLNRLVAVKILLPQFAANKDFAERVIAEVQAVSDITHTNVVKIYEADHQEGTYFIAMEYVRGIKLKDKIRRLAPFSPALAISLAIAVGEALEYAHQRSIVHGDVRPQNVIVTSDSQVKITDFGMAAAISSFPRVQTSASLRSIHYTAPEVAEGKVPRQSSDIYSLGIVLYEMLTGTVPFDGDTPIAVALRHAKDPPPSPRMLNATIPRSVEHVVLKALQKLPDERYRNMAEMLQDLRAAREAMASAPAVQPVDAPPVYEEAVPERKAEASAPRLLSSLLKYTFLLLVVTIVAFASVFGYFVLSNPAEVQAPPLVGRSEGEALAIAGQEGLRMLVVERTYDEKFPDGQIYNMFPEAGMRIKKGQTLKVWVSRGPRFTQVPDVTDMPEDKARRQIINSGLVVGELVQEYSDKTPAGSISKQRPVGGSQSDRGKPVSLFISLGKKPTEESPIVEPRTEESTGPQRSFSVGITVPLEGPEQQTVKITVKDDFGENVVYEEHHHPGDRVREVVTGAGKPIYIRVYLDDALVDEQIK